MSNNPWKAAIPQVPNPTKPVVPAPTRLNPPPAPYQPWTARPSNTNSQTYAFGLRIGQYTRAALTGVKPYAPLTPVPYVGMPKPGAPVLSTGQKAWGDLTAAEQAARWNNIPWAAMGDTMRAIQEIKGAAGALAPRAKPGPGYPDGGGGGWGGSGGVRGFAESMINWRIG